jgi:hypothetical protein
MSASTGRHPDLVDGAVDGLASGDSEHHLDQVEAPPGGGAPGIGTEGHEGPGAESARL